MSTLRRPTFLFGPFSLDAGSFELWREGTPVRLERRPLELLLLLLERHGNLVTRDEIVSRLWGPGIFVDVEAGVHTAVRKVRAALGDSPTAPTYVATVPGRGYRFIAPVEVVAPDPTAAPPVVVAVLPFVLLDADPSRAYVADGLTEDTISTLSLVAPDRLRVVSRTTVQAVQAAGRPLRDIGLALGADVVVESSIRFEGERLRITARLVRTGDQTLLWSATFDRHLGSVLGLQEELSATIADQVHVRLTTDPDRAAPRRQTTNADAYLLYLQGRYFWGQLTPSTNLKALALYERATEADPDYALAWAGIADVRAASLLNADCRPAEAGERAREAALRAVTGGPHLPEANFSMAYAHFFVDWDFAAAERGFRRVTALDPSHALGHMLLAHVVSQRGRHDEAAELAARARALDEQRAIVHALSAQIAFQARDFEAALVHAGRAESLDPHFWIACVQVGQAEAALGRDERAVAAYERATRFSNSNSKAVAFHGYLDATSGRHAEARARLAALVTLAHTRYVPPCAPALIHAGLGEVNEAFACLERALEERDVHLVFLPCDHRWDVLRDDPRFDALVRRCGFEA